MRILIAAGGTGGHIYPALAVARSLAERSAEAEFRWLGGHRGLESSIVPAAGYELDLLWLRSLLRLDPWVPRGTVWAAPQLPESIRELRVSGIRLGDTRLDIEVTQGEAKVTSSGAPLEVQTTPRPPLTALFDDH